MNKIIRKIQTPFGVFAGFGLLIEGIAAFALTSSALNEWQMNLIVIFLVSFPIFVFICFIFLLITQTGKLYGPSDYKDPSDFMKVIGLKVDASVGKVNTDMVSQMAALDIEMIPFWERKNNSVPGDGMDKLALLETWVTKLEEEVAIADPINKSSHISALREVYIKYLEQARLCHASGQNYQKIRKRVIDGLNKISNQAT